MRYQFLGSLLVGGGLTAACFLPLLVWQYRRFGRFDALRMAWYAAAFVYSSAIVAFTIFPLPDFSDGYCRHLGNQVLLDPLRFPRAFAQLAAQRGLLAAATDWMVAEIALNIALFVPFGLITRRVLQWPRATVFAAALATSVLIETTQLTGNWGLAPCAYRFADTTDLITNTLGAVLGIGLEALTPRLLASSEHLRARRHQARPVTRGRRWAGMILDAWYVLIATALACAAAWALFGVAYYGSTELTGEQTTTVVRGIFLAGWGAAMTVVIGPALTRHGASLGQRTVYLQPVPRNGRRWRHVARAASVQGVVVTCLTLALVAPLAPAAYLWALLAAASVAGTPRGLSCLLSGCTLRDARTPVPSDPDTKQDTRRQVR